MCIRDRAGQTADLEHLPLDIRPASPTRGAAGHALDGNGHAGAIGAAAFSEVKRIASDQAEREFLERGLQEVGGVVTELARRCDMNRSHLQSLLKKHGIRSKDSRPASSSRRGQS